MMMNRVRLPGLLDASLSETARLRPSSGSLTLNMVGSGEASLILPEDGPAVHIHDWVSMYTQNGFAGIFRVSNVSQTFRRQTEITLLHGIDILADSVWPAQFEFSGTKAQFLTQLLNQQTHLVNGVKPWALGSCADNTSYERQINYDRLSTLFEDLVQDGGNYYFVYDQTSFPWTVSCVAKPQGVSGEFRLSRNVRSASVTYNDADLCTRLHLSVSSKRTSGSGSQPVYGSAVKTYDNTAAQAIWGVVVKTADIDTHDDIQEQHFESADAWAEHFLSLRAEPSVQIQIDGDELALLTGDSWDELSIGKLCRVALPDYGHSFEERVVSVSYPDLFRDPSHVTVSLANTLPRFSESIAQAREVASVAARSARASARSIEKDEKEITHWSQKVQYHDLALDGTGVLTLYESGIDMDATGGVTIYSLQDGLQALYSSIQVNAQGITLQGQTITSIGSTVQNLSGTVTTIDGKVSTIEGSALWQNESGLVAINGELEVQTVDGVKKLVVKSGGGLFVTRNNTQLGVWDSGNLTAGIIIQKVNGGTGETGDTTLSTEILGDKIKLTTGSGASRFTLSDKIIIDSDGYTKVNGLFMASGTGVNAKHVTINNGKITAGGGLDISAAQTLTFIGSGSQEYYGISANASPANRSIKNFVTGFGTVTVDSTINKAKIPYDTVYSSYANQNSQVIEIPIPATAIASITLTPPASGSNTYTLSATKTDGTPVSIGTFSRATTLSGGWGSGAAAGIFSVDASPQDQHYKIKFNGTSGTADATLDAVVSASGVTPILNGAYLQFTLNIGTYTEGADMFTRAALTRSVPCSSVTGMAATNPLTVAAQTDAQWDDLSGVTEITSSITSGGKYLITASPKYGAPAQLKFIAPSGGGGGETINVAKGSWTSGGATGWSSIVFSPSPASGTSVTLEMRGSLTEGSSNRTALWVRDRALTLPINGINQTYTIQPNSTRDYVVLVNDSTGNVVAQYAINDTSRTVTSLDPITLSADHTSSTPYNVTVNYSDGTTGYSTITVDASAISGGGGSDDRTVTSLTPNPITLTRSQYNTSSHTLTAHYSTGSDSTVPVSVDASAVYAEGLSVGAGMEITSNMVIDISSNGNGQVFYPTPYDAASKVTVNVSVPGSSGTITDITAPSIAGNQLVSNVTLTASGTNVAAPYTESVTLGKSTYNVGSFTKDCVTLTIDNNVVGRIATGYTKATVTLISGAPTWITPAVTSSAFTLTGAGYRRLFYYSDTEERYIDAAADGRTHYWYYSNSHVNTGDYAPMGTYTQYYPMSSVTQDSDTYYTKDS